MNIGFVFGINSYSTIPINRTTAYVTDKQGNVSSDRKIFVERLLPIENPTHKHWLVVMLVSSNLGVNGCMDVTVYIRL